MKEYNTPQEIEELTNAMMLSYANEPSKLWLQDFFIKRSITKKTIERLRGKNEQFSEAYSLCKDIQESRLVKTGLTATPGAQRVIAMALKNLAGWRNDPKDEPEETPRAVIVMRPARLAATDFDVNDDDEDGYDD